MAGPVRRLLVAVVSAGLIGASAASAQTVNITPYAWEFPSVTGVNSATDMIGRLQEEVQKVLDGGRLTPMRAYYADQGSFEEYWLYMQPGRIITTLAWAHPYLTAAQQASVRTYVSAELADATHAPWATSPMSVTAGTTRRELHPLNRVTYFTPAFATRQPSVHTIYGLWLYAYRTGDWALIQSYWSTIQSMYAARASQGDIYGTMGAHVAMARMADHFGTTAVRTTALNNLQTQLNAGLNFATVESRVSSTYWPEMYTTRRQSGVHQGWMFLNMSPEIGRYLAANVASATLARNASGKTKYPLWWMSRANYSGRWTGDEGIGIPTEMMGMVMPVERWVAQTDASTLRDYMRSGPTGIGDSYWLESLVQAIEATGTLVWTDVRSGTPGCNYSVSAPSFSVPSGASTQTESVTSTAGCTWTTSSNAGWITVSPATGTGSGTVTLTIAANTGTARAGTASVAGQTVTVNQAAGSGGTAPAPPTNLRVQ